MAARIHTVRLRALAREDLARLLRLPAHPVHASAMRTLGRYAGAGKIMLAREPESDELRGYLSFHRINPATVMLDFLYCPYPREGTGTQLMDRFEAQHAGMTAVLMSTSCATGFYARRGYDADHPYMFSKQLSFEI